MSYSYTEKKRIRKEFSNLTDIINVPHLLHNQVGSYQGFLQKDIDPNKRKNIGLESAFKSIFPIVSNSGYAEIHYINYTLSKPLVDLDECHIRGVHYASPIKVKLKLILYDKNKSLEN